MLICFSGNFYIPIDFNAGRTRCTVGRFSPTVRLSDGNTVSAPTIGLLSKLPFGNRNADRCVNRQVACRTGTWIDPDGICQRSSARASGRSSNDYPTGIKRRIFSIANINSRRQSNVGFDLQSQRMIFGIDFYILSLMDINSRLHICSKITIPFTVFRIYNNGIFVKQIVGKVACIFLKCDVLRCSGNA